MDFRALVALPVGAFAIAAGGVQMVLVGPSFERLLTVLVGIACLLIAAANSGEREEQVIFSGWKKFGAILMLLGLIVLLGLVGIGMQFSQYAWYGVFPIVIGFCILTN